MKRFSLLNFLLFVTAVGFATPVVMSFLPQTPISFDHLMERTFPEVISWNDEGPVWEHIPKSQGPQWSSDQRNPPLSARAAIAIAFARSDSLDFGDPPSEWEFQSASLCTVDALNEYWCWRIQFQSVEETNQGRGLLCVAVLMDGTVVGHR